MKLTFHPINSEYSNLCIYEIIREHLRMHEIGRFPKTMVVSPFLWERIKYEAQVHEISDPPDELRFRNLDVFRSTDLEKNEFLLL